MSSRLWPRRGPAAALAALALAPGAVAATAQESAMVRLLRSGKVPTDRQGTLIELIGKQGSPADLGFLLEQAADPDGFAPENRRSGAWRPSPTPRRTAGSRPRATSRGSPP